jgi:hypothetical protein
MPIVNNLKELEVGLKLAVVEHEYRIFKFYAIHGVYDKPARADILNIKNSTGYFGCVKCRQRGESFKTRKSID